MKKILILSTFVLFALSASAQHEVKTNALGILFTQYNVAYEYILNDDAGINGSITFFSTPKLLSSIGSDLQYKAFSLSGDYRMYFNPDEPASGFFLAPYAKYRNISLTDLIWDVNTDTGETANLDLKQGNFGLGLGIGTKRVSNSGIIFEFVGGLGRYLVSSLNYTYTDGSGNVEDGAENLPDGLGGWDVRLQVTVGYRFGG